MLGLWPRVQWEKVFVVTPVASLSLTGVQRRTPARTGALPSSCKSLALGGSSHVSMSTHKNWHSPMELVLLYQLPHILPTETGFVRIGPAYKGKQLLGRNIPCVSSLSSQVPE